MLKARVAAVFAVVACCLAFVAAAFAEYTTHHWAGNTSSQADKTAS
jgi:hypothetical protein